MAEWLLWAAVVILVTVALGLVRLLRGPGDADRMMAAQLLGTGGVAVLLLVGTATGTAGVTDLALVLALLAAFATVAFVTGVQAVATPFAPAPAAVQPQPAEQPAAHPDPHPDPHPHPHQAGAR